MSKFQWSTRSRWQMRWAAAYVHFLASITASMRATTSSPLKRVTRRGSLLSPEKPQVAQKDFMASNSSGVYTSSSASTRSMAILSDGFAPPASSSLCRKDGVLNTFFASSFEKRFITALGASRGLTICVCWRRPSTYPSSKWTFLFAASHTTTLPLRPVTMLASDCTPSQRGGGYSEAATEGKGDFAVSCNAHSEKSSKLASSSSEDLRFFACDAVAMSENYV